RIVPPRAVVIARGHRLAELAVVGNVDAEVALPAHHVGNGGSEDLRECGVVHAFACGARPARGDETCRPRQASGMGGEHTIGTASHGSPRPFGNSNGRLLDRLRLRQRAPPSSLTRTECRFVQREEAMLYRSSIGAISLLAALLAVVVDAPA